MTSQTVVSSVHPAADVSGGTTAMRIWLWGVALLVFAMVIVGGATRLTESGLSITEWKPVLGAIPPLSEAAWLAEFERYKQIPQYSQMFPTMALSDFKFIYYWEWSHRLLGRLIGIAFALPLLWFWLRGQVKGKLRWQLPAVLALGGLQGAVGWWMVASGLAGRTEVAPERLMIHLILASITLVALVAIAVGLTGRSDRDAAAWAKRGALILLVAVLLQIALGALVAGSRAGLSYNSWPLMDGSFVPNFMFRTDLEPTWRNFFENVTIVQFQHRMWAYALLAIALWHAFSLRATLAAGRAWLLLGMVIVQAGLGIATLLLVFPEGRIPIGWALAHQGFAMCVLIVATVHWRRLAVAKS
ncbi:MAG: heme A synthase [Rhizobiales bacterium 62-17]|nr:COX15/CtaA family protein [Hyphomicrobiales bacterium]OJY04157.1 MAG: heme A synthase [Rhizobiales bacterium 62-17]